MNRNNSFEFIYKAINAIASGKHDPETEQCLSDAIEEELFAINASRVLEGWRGVTATTPAAEVHLA
jgi:hypothetical protein